MPDITYPTAEDAKRGARERLRNDGYMEISKDLYYHSTGKGLDFGTFHICGTIQDTPGNFRPTLSGVYWSTIKGLATTEEHLTQLLICNTCKERWYNETAQKALTMRGLKEITS